MTFDEISFRRLVTGAAAAFGCAMLAATALAQQAVVAGRFGAWSLHISEGANHKICFAVSEPKQKQPASANRATALVYISAWPRDGVKGEFSVKLGYKVKAEAPITAEAGGATFKLFAKDERGYSADQTEEARLVDAMKKSGELVVKATSERGTATTDTYSLAGLTDVLKALAVACP